MPASYQGAVSTAETSRCEIPCLARPLQVDPKSLGQTFLGSTEALGGVHAVLSRRRRPPRFRKTAEVRIRLHSGGLKVILGESGSMAEDVHREEGHRR